MPEPVAPLHGRRFYVFGPFRLDPGNRLLLRDGQPVPLTAKVFDLLLHFVENRDRLLTKDEILQRVWPDSFVEEGNLARHVSMLRKALNEGPRDHAYIVTVSGRGYRFVAHVSAVTEPEGWKTATLQAVEYGSRDTEVVAASDPAIQPATGSRRRAGRLALTAAGLLLAALVSGHWIRTRTAAVHPPASLNLEWRTNTGDVYGPAVSRDGAYMAYCWLAPGGLHGLRVRQLTGGNTIDVIPPAAVWYWSIRFSAKADYIYYVIADFASNSRGTLFRVPTLGGRPERLTEHVSGGIALSRDGQSVAFTRISAEPPSVAIMTVGAAGGEPRTVMTLDVPGTVQSLDWSPDRRTLLVPLRRRETGGDRWHIAEVPVSGDAPTIIVPPRSTRITQAVWLPERRGLLMNAIDPASGLPQIWHVSYPDGAERRLTDDLHNYKDLTVTADGSRVVAQSLGHLVQLWVAPGNGPGEATQVASGTLRGAYDALAWAANDQLLYRWGERGAYEMWRMAPDGSARRQLTANAHDVSDTSVAPDRSHVFFVSTRSGSPQIWRMRPNGDDIRQLTRMKSSAMSPVASADGRWVYFAADERGFPTLWKMTTDGQSVTEVSDKPIELFDLSPDGRWLAYSYKDSHRECLRVTVVALDGTGPEKHFDIEPTYALKWSPDGERLVFAHRQGNLWVQPIAGGTPYAVTPAYPGFNVVTFAWSPDARHLAYTLMANPVDAIAFALR